MEREIIFRGKRLSNGNWVDGSLLVYADGDCFICCEDYIPDVLNKYSVDPATVGQYTGLRDRNGKKIFEGDVLDFINEYRGRNNKWKCVVEFTDGCLVCRYIEKEGHLGEYNHFCSWNVPLVKWMVIGNIYDNPELLEVKR